MEKTRDLKKVRDTKGTFHAKMGTIKERNGKDLTEAEEIKRRQEYKKHQYSILTHIYGVQKDGNDNPVCETAKETQYRTVFWTLWERKRVG